MPKYDLTACDQRYLDFRVDPRPLFVGPGLRAGQGGPGR